MEAAQTFIAAVIPESPTGLHARWMLQHCWAVWEYPAHPRGWKHGKEAAVNHIMASRANWRQFRKDLVQHLVAAGLPGPYVPDAEDERARRLTAAIMDNAIANAPARGDTPRCAGCGKGRDLAPGLTHCYACRKKQVGAAILPGE